MNLTEIIKNSNSNEIIKKISNEMTGKFFHHHSHIIYDIRTILGKEEKTYLEINCNDGGCMSLMLQHEYPTKIIGISNNNEIILKNIKKFNIHNRDVKLYNYDIVNPYNYAINIIKNNITTDILIINGTQKYSDVMNIWELYYPLVSENGYILIDNYEDYMYSSQVRKAVDKIVENIKNNLYVGFFEIIGSLENIKNPYCCYQLNRNNLFIIKKISKEHDLKFGIVMSTYYRNNGKTYSQIKRAIDSIKNQSYKNYKLFLMGDKYENQEEFNKISKLLDENYIEAENLPYALERDNCKIKFNLWSIGGANAINKGIDKVLNNNYDIYVHIDDDDFWHKNHLMNLFYGYKINNFKFLTSTGITLKKDWILPYDYFDTKKFYTNNYVPDKYSTFHSSISFNIKDINIRMITIDIEEGEKKYIAADAQFLSDIKNICHKNKYYTGFIPFISCIRDDECESIE